MHKDMNGAPLYQGDSVEYKGQNYFIVSLTFDGMLVLSLDGTRNESIIVAPETTTTNWEEN